MDLPSQEPQLLATPESPVAKRRFTQAIFMSDDGLRAGWRLLVYAVLVRACVEVTGQILRHFLHVSEGTLTMGVFYLSESASLFVALAPALFMSWIEGKPMGTYGLPALEAFQKRFWQGWLVGLGEISVLVGLVAVFGGYSFGALALHGVQILNWAVLWAGFFLLVGFTEEFMFRGYSQYTLADGIGFWPAAILLSLLFGAAHRGNSGESWVGIAAVVGVGLVLAFALKRTGSLWFAVGMHASFDFGETFLYSVPNSGLILPGHLSNAILRGSNWISGGTAGPEGSIFSFVTMGAVAVLIHIGFPPKKPLEQQIKEALEQWSVNQV